MPNLVKCGPVVLEKNKNVRRVQTNRKTVDGMQTIKESSFELSAQLN